MAFERPECCLSSLCHLDALLPVIGRVLLVTGKSLGHETVGKALDSLPRVASGAGNICDCGVTRRYVEQDTPGGTGLTIGRIHHVSMLQERALGL